MPTAVQSLVLGHEIAYSVELSPDGLKYAGCQKIPSSVVSKMTEPDWAEPACEVLGPTAKHSDELGQLTSVNRGEASWSTQFVLVAKVLGLVKSPPEPEEKLARRTGGSTAREAARDWTLVADAFGIVWHTSATPRARATGTAIRRAPGRHPRELGRPSLQRLAIAPTRCLLEGGTIRWMSSLGNLAATLIFWRENAKRHQLQHSARRTAPTPSTNRWQRSCDVG
jgi:hypothetical protein